MEVWKEIHGYNERYEVSNYGRVRSNDMIINGRLQNCHHKKGRILKPHTDKEGYKGVVLCVNQKRKTFRLHRLVAAAFIPNPDNLPEIDHIDGDRANNHADNLRWVTVKENQNNPITKSKWIGRKAKPHHEKAIEQIKNGIVVNVFVSIQEAARKGNFSATAICKVCKGKGNLHKGYKWRYKK